MKNVSGMSLRFNLVELTALRHTARRYQLDLNAAVRDFDAEVTIPNQAERIATRETLYNRWRVWQTLERRFDDAHLIAAHYDASLTVGA